MRSQDIRERPLEEPETYYRDLYYGLIDKYNMLREENDELSEKLEEIRSLLEL